MYINPMTRSRVNDATGVPSALAAQYYAQRADAGLIITEGTFPSPMGKGYVRTPGIHSAAQIDGWKRVTGAAHARGGLIFLQLMHTGRISHPSLLPTRATPVAPSAIAAEGQVYTATGPQDFVVPRALDTGEIAGVVDEYRRATRHALQACFDGIELHAALTPILAQANRLLLAQFAQVVIVRRAEAGLPVAHEIEGSHPPDSDKRRAIFASRRRPMGRLVPAQEVRLCSRANS